VGQPATLRWGRRFAWDLLLLQDGVAFFVGEDGAFKMAEGGGFEGGKFDLADDVFALVVKDVALGGDGGVIAGEVEVDVYGVGGFIDDVAGGEGDVEGVAPAAGGVEVDGDGAGLVVEGDGVSADDAGAEQQERAGLVGVLVSGDLVVEFEWFVEFAGLNELEGVEGDAGKGRGDVVFPFLAPLLFIGIFQEFMRKSPPSGPTCEVSTEPVMVPSACRVNFPTWSVPLASGGSTGRAMTWLEVLAARIP
jgi:hypothetical protein